jgi:DNA polymerase III delta prime subunit
MQMKSTLTNILVTGGDQKNRLSFALGLAKKLLCLNQDPNCKVCQNCQRIELYNHPNLVLIAPTVEGGFSPINEDRFNTIKIEQIRRIIEENQKASFEDGPGIFIITHMHRATTAAQNALLKTIEESGQNKVFVALAPSRSSVLPTISSRLSHVSIKPTPLNDLILEQSIIDQIMTISLTQQKNRLDLCSHFSADRELLLEELYQFSFHCHIMVRNKAINFYSALHILEAIQKACSEVERNQNTRLVVEQMLLCNWPYNT